VPCVSDVDCNGRRSAADNDSKDGCVCECLDGWSGNDCFVEPQQATTTIDAGKAIDDGTQFDLYTSGKYTLLSLPRHATGSEAESNMNDFEYQQCRDAIAEEDASDVVDAKDSIVTTEAEIEAPGNCIQAPDVVAAKDIIVTSKAEIEARENCIQAVDKCVVEAIEQRKEQK
jgi:hypothetical protein